MTPARVSCIMSQQRCAWAVNDSCTIPRIQLVQGAGRTVRRFFESVGLVKYFKSEGFAKSFGAESESSDEPEDSCATWGFLRFVPRDVGPWFRKLTGASSSTKGSEPDSSRRSGAFTGPGIDCFGTRTDFPPLVGRSRFKGEPALRSAVADFDAGVPGNENSSARLRRGVRTTSARDSRVSGTASAVSVAERWRCFFLCEEPISTTMLVSSCRDVTRNVGRKEARNTRKQKRQIPQYQTRRTRRGARNNSNETTETI